METFDLDIIRKVHGVFVEKGLRLSVAESCTAGLLSHALTTLPGASEFFDSSLVCYSRSAKKKLLGISESFLKKHGTVSEDTAREMAEAARDLTGADVVIAVTGVLGPAHVEELGPGLIYMAVATELETTSRGYKFDGDRDAIKHSATGAALHFLYEAVSIWA